MSFTGLQMCEKKKADLSQVYELHGIADVCVKKQAQLGQVYALHGMQMCERRKQTWARSMSFMG